MPTYSDAEGHTPTLTYSTLPSFITYDGIDTFTFTPTQNSEIGTTTVTVTLSDGNKSNNYNIVVNVMTKPTFTDGTTSFANLIVSLNSVGTFKIPPFSDLDGDSVSILVFDINTGTNAASWIQI